MKKLYLLCNLCVFFTVYSIRSYAQCPEVTYGALGSSLELYSFGWAGSQYFSPASWNNVGVTPGNHGEERIVTFTPPASAVYDIDVNNSFGWGGMAAHWRLSNNLCDLTGYQYAYYNVYDPAHFNFTLSNLIAGNHYNIITYPYDSGAIGNATLTINCANAKNLSITNVQSTSAVLNFDCACPNPVILEYGPAGFTPGTGTSGNGTLVANVTSPYTLTGLSPYSFYNVYLRSSCGAIYTDNSVITFRSGIDCANAPVLTCGSTFTYSHNLGDNSGNWNINCPTTANSSFEAVYRFTPTQTGMYLLTNYSGSYYLGNSIAAYYKQMGSCDATGWNCIGAITHPPQGLSFGPLTANTTYLLYFDANSNAGNTIKNIRLDCVNPCTATITPNSSIIICQGLTTTLQANTGAGITYQWYRNGVLVAGATSSSYAASTAGWYSVVENTPCGIVTSDNTLISVFPSVSTSVTYNTALSFCPNGYVQLNATPNYYATTYQWQRNGVNIPGATQMSYQATDSGTYRVQASASLCIASFSSNVTVNKATSVTGFYIANSIGVICPGGNILLSLRNSQSLSPNYLPTPGYIYQWKNNGVNIPGATSTTYNVTSAGSYTCLVTATCGTFTTAARVITTATLPTVSIAANGPTTFCNSSVNLTATITGGAVTTTWKRNGVVFFSGYSQIQNASVTGTYVCEVTNTCGTVVSNAINVTANKSPVISAISGNIGFCRPSTGNVYSVTPQAGVTFNWTLPTGATVTNGQGTNSVTVSFASNAVSGNICVVGSNAACGAGTASCKSIVLRTTVSIPGTITGSNSAACTLSRIYSIRKVATAEYYIWTPPAGAKINGSVAPLQTPDTVIVLQFDSTFVGDTLRVKSVNCFGVSAERKLKIKNILMATPGTITGNVYSNCNGYSLYAIAPVANAVTYTWRTTVPGATIAGSSLPYTTNNTSVNILFANGLSGKVYVKANSACLSSAEKSLSVYSKPAAPTVINGLATVCDSALMVNYNTPLISGATTYNWTVITGSTIASGQGTNSINVNFGGTATIGSIKVRSQNVCANSAYFSKTVTVNNCNRFIDADAKTELQLYPNPFSTTATLILPAETNLDACEVSIYDVFGKQVRVISKPEQYTLEIERKDMSPGIYFIKVISGGMENQVVKMIVE